MSPIPTDLVGTEVGDRYRIVREIGRGGMGVVYEAHDQVLDRAVALKFLDLRGPDEQFRERFRHEAAVLARVHSRHIVAIFDYETHEGTPYLVTQLVPDGDLHTRLNAEGAMEPAKALAMALQVCEALADAHAEGVLHRDVKPANVLLHQQRSGDFRAFLCDFGIAISGDSQLTKTGAVVGSTSYMAPERLNGASASIAADVYSLGCLVWAMLTGRAPYEGTEFQVMDAHVNGPPPHFLVGPPLASRLNVFFARAMAKDPDQRYASVSEAADVLESLVGEAAGVGVGELEPGDPPPIPVAARPGWTPAGVAADDGATRMSPTPGFAGAGAAARPPVDDGNTRLKPTPGSPPPRPAGPPVVVGAGAPVPGADRTVSRPLLSSGTPPPGSPPSAYLAAGGGTGSKDVAGSAGSGGSSGGSGRTGSGGRRSRGTIAAVLALLLVGVVGVVLTLTLGGDEGGGEVAVATDTASPDAPTSPSPTDVEATPDPDVAPVAAKPRLEVTPGYRSILVRATKVPDGLTLQRRVGDDDWRDVAQESRVSAVRGGDRVCAGFRFVREGASLPAGAGDVVRSCGRAKPPSIQLIRTSIECTSANQAAGCRYYNIRAAGFEPGSEPLVYLYTRGTTLFCPACVPRPMTMDETGRGVHDGPRPSSLGEVQITPSSVYPRVTVEIDGVRRTFELL
jgi:hypothetical protein